MVQFKLKIDFTGFEQKIYKALEKKMKPVLYKAASGASVKIRRRFRDLILASDTVSSLMGGTLKGEFGMLDIHSRITNIIDKWTSKLTIKQKPIRITARGLNGGFTLYMVKSDWSEVLTGDRNADLFVTPKNSQGKQYDLHWLRWLLVEGSKIVVKEYDFKKMTGGRTGLGVMVKDFQRGFWQVPHDFVGTTNNNFVTRIIETMHTDLEKILTDEMKRAI